MDPVFMLKSIVAQRLFGKADKDFELEMLQNSVLQDWLGINYPSDVPSHKTIWKYKEIFAQTEVLEKFGKSKGNYNIQTVDAFHSGLKDFVNYRFNGVATKYLNNYATWHGFLHSLGVDQDEAEEFLYEVALTAVCPSAGKQVSDREAVPVLSEKQKRFMEILLMNLASQELQDRIDALERLLKRTIPRELRNVTWEGVQRLEWIPPPRIINLKLFR